MKRSRPRRNVKIIFPSTITTFTLVFGYLAIIVATTTDNYVKACHLVILAMVMDALDGKVARLTNTATDFGIQYDSLADLVGFGVAPCLIYSHFFLHEQKTDQIYYLLPIMYLVCGGIRLARFNVTASIYGKSHFVGLPIPAAAFVLLALPLFHDWTLTYQPIQDLAVMSYLTKSNLFQASWVIMMVISISMISRVRFDTPGSFFIHRYKIKWVNYAILVLLISLWPLFGLAILFVVTSLYYLLAMFIRGLFIRLSKTVPPLDGPEDITES